MENIFVRRDQISQGTEVLELLRRVGELGSQRVEVVKKTFGGPELKVGSSSYKISSNLTFLPELLALVRKWNSEYGDDFVPLMVSTLEYMLFFFQQGKKVYVGTPFPMKEIAVISETGILNQPYARVHVGTAYLSLFAFGLFTDPIQNPKVNAGFGGTGMWLIP